MTRQKFVYRLKRSDYEKEWGTTYKRSRLFFRKWGEGDAQMGLLARFLVFMFQLLPKVGPLQTLNFKPPTPATQERFAQSFQATLDQYRKLLDHVQNNQLLLENKDLDTGKSTKPGDYELVDKTYTKLLHKLAEDHFRGVTPELRNNLVAFYDLNAPFAAKKDAAECQKTLHELEQLEGTPAPATQN